MYEYLNVSASVSGSYGFFSADASYGLEKESSFGEDTFSWIVYGYSNYGRFGLDKVELTQEAKNLSNNPIAFRALCGTDYVFSEVRAVQAAAVFKIHNLTSSQRSVLTASVSGGFGNGVLDVSGGVNYQNFVKEAAKYGQIEVSLYALGGPGITALNPIITKYDDPNVVLTTFQTYFSNLTLQYSVPISYNTASIQAKLGRPQIETDFFNKYIADLWISSEELSAERERLRNIRRNSADYSLTEAQKNAIDTELTTIAGLRSEIQSRANACREAYLNVSAGITTRRAECGKAVKADNYTPSVGALPAKPFKLTYWTSGTLVPGEEVIHFDVVGAKIKNVTIIKQLNSPTPTDVNNVAISSGTDGMKHAGDTLLMSSFSPTDFPVGIKVEMDSGNTYTDRFIYTPATPITTYAAPLKINGGPLSVLVTTDEAAAKTAFESGRLVPASLKEPTRRSK